MGYLGLILIIIGCICLIVGAFDDHADSAFGGFIFIVLGLLLLLINIPSEINNNKPVLREHIYQVKELERGTVFNISDSIGGFQAKDTVWVSINTLRIDPGDSTAMMSVIIKEIKR